MLAFCALALGLVGVIAWRFAGLRRRFLGWLSLGFGAPVALAPADLIATPPERYAGFRPACLAIVLIEAMFIAGVLTVSALAASSAYGQAESRLEAFLHGAICRAIVSGPA